MVSSTDGSGMRRPTLMLLRYTSDQACSDVNSVVQQVEQGLSFLGAGGDVSSDTRAVDQRLQMYGPPAEVMAGLNQHAKKQVALQSTVGGRWSGMAALLAPGWLPCWPRDGCPAGPGMAALLAPGWLPCWPRDGCPAGTSCSSARGWLQRSPAPGDLCTLGGWPCWRCHC
jgi:hypothetical protein